MQKTFVLDTNVLLHNPLSLQGFGKNKVVIPIYVIQEIDHFKKEQNDLGRNAREASRVIDSLREKGDLTQGVLLNESLIEVRSTKQLLPTEFIIDEHNADKKILALALELHLRGPEEVILVTKDTNLRILAAALKVKSKDYVIGHTKEEPTVGIPEYIVDPKIIDDLFLYKQTEIPFEKTLPNTFAILSNGAQKSAVVRFYPQLGVMKPIVGYMPWKLNARNVEQQIAFELLMDPTIRLVTMTGIAGSGKTLCSLSAGLSQVLEKNPVYSRMLVARPIVPLGHDLGALPGDLSEKVRPWMQPIYDNLEVLMGFGEKEKRKGRSVDELFDMNHIQVEALMYIRGRSLPKQFFLIDESQNISPHMAKTLITRAGEGTKIVMVGDVFQGDDPYLDVTSNGLSYVIQKFKGQPIAGHINLVKGERSELAELGAQLL